jgi:hypothetical protein
MGNVEIFGDANVYSVNARCCGHAKLSTHELAVHTGDP